MSYLFARRPTRLYPPLLLGSQLVFNIGFYAVVPFLAIFVRDDMLLSGWAVGLIIGLRTFSQQGMFLVGGALAGNAVQNNMGGSVRDIYRVTVQLQDGSQRSFDYPNPPPFRIGDNVRVDGNQIYR